MRRSLTLGVLFGMTYNVIEVFYNAISSGTWDLVGASSVWMFLVGGAAGVVLGKINEPGSCPACLPYPIQVILGGSVITSLEFLSGLILNVWLGLDIWDYSSAKLNIMGQIDLWHSFCWILVTPTAFWVDDVLRHYLYEKARPATLFGYYKRLLTYK